MFEPPNDSWMPGFVYCICAIMAGAAVVILLTALFAGFAPGWIMRFP